ncbi:unnamed protein product [Hyaloperonospora brassicae]|uniref:RxLR effector candidate protein n=1 Tax=Hyaloperonospora brassicae TaxID=162125 RepID=A0AAV0UJQ2_HYABA|nr:unnamed protein product [Hyaloperonospora brassicae]
MLRRAVQRTRLHLPAPTGHDNGSALSPSDSEDEGDGGGSLGASLSVAYTSLRDDASARDSFRQRLDDFSDVQPLIAALEPQPTKRTTEHVAKLSMDEDRRAAEVWKRLQTLYGLFQALSKELPVEKDGGWPSARLQRPQADATTRQRRRDDGLRSLLQATRLPSGVVLRDVQTLATVDDTKDDQAMPQGFTASMFAVLGNALYNEMLVAAGQNRISRDVLEELGNCLYTEAANVAVIAVDA